LFDAVQARLAKSPSRSGGGSRKAVSLLAGMIRDDRGRPMSRAKLATTAVATPTTPRT
jgi:hypothetical protein